MVAGGWCRLTWHHQVVLLLMQAHTHTEHRPAGPNPLYPLTERIILPIVGPPAMFYADTLFNPILSRHIPQPLPPGSAGGG